MDKKILVIGVSFPSKKSVAEGVYLYNLMRFFKKSFDLIIFSPRRFFRKRNKYIEMDEFSGLVHRPVFYNLSRLSKKFSKITYDSYYQSIYKNLPQVDLIYAHFLYPAGYAAYRIAKNFNKPYFVALGESTFDSYKSEESKEIVHQATGIIVVSDKIKDFLVDNMGVMESKVLVAPNQADHHIFKPLDKIECRKELQIDLESKVIIFVGQFIHRKGYNRVLEALKYLPYDVKCIFIGKGEMSEESDKILFKGTVENKLLPKYYNAADFFILPTLSEGSCNAIAEAICCGLPIISSDIKEVKEQVFLDSSMLIDPQDPKEIAIGVEKMYENLDLYKERALINSSKNNLETRANSIKTFILNKCNE